MGTLSLSFASMRLMLPLQFALVPAMCLAGVLIPPDSDAHEDTKVKLDHFKPLRSTIWKNLLEDRRYDKGDMPSHGTGKALPVSVGVIFNRIGTLRPSQGFAEMQVTCRMKWTDPRLTWDPEAKEAALDIYSVVMTKDEEAADLIWRPDVTLQNLVGFNHDRSLSTTVINSDGLIFWGRVFDGSFAHGFDFRWFPFDTQYPTVHIESFRYNNNYQLLHWDRKVAASISGQLHSLFNVTGIYFYTSNKTYEDVPNLVYTRLICKVVMVRLWASYMLKVVLPISFMVYISVLSYYINPASAPARVGLSVTCLLTQVAFSRSTTGMFPVSGDLTWLDYFILFALLHNVCALLEYAVVFRMMMDEEAKAEGRFQRIDAAARKYVPASFTLVLAIMLGIGMAHETPDPRQV